MRSANVRGRRHDEDLLRAKIDGFLDEAPHARRPVAQPMRLTPPIGVGGERQWHGLADERSRQAARNHGGEVLAGDATQIQDFTAAFFRGFNRRPANELSTPRFDDEREDQIAPGVDVVNGQDQLSKSGLPEVFSNQLHAAPAELD